MKELNVDIEHENGRAKTPLLVAATNGHDKLVQKLIDLKANVNASDANGDTALH